MKKITANSIAILLSTMIVSGVSFGADRAIADGLAAAGAAQYAKGNVDLAKDFLYKALVNDENCTDAVFELARVFDKENNTAASDFYLRSIQLFNKEGKAADPAKRAEAEKRVKALNPHAPRLSATYEEYAQELDRLVKRIPEPAVKEAAYVRATELDLPTILTADKVPKFYAAAQAAAKAAAQADSNKKPGEKTTSPEVERELKALGWTTVKGYFEKKGPGVYESTEGRLESAKTNGAVEFTVLHSGGDGEVIATVRSEFKVDKNNDGGGQGGGGGPGGGGGGPGGGRRGGFGGWGRRSSTEGYGFIARAKDYKEYGVDDNANKFFASKGPVEVGSGKLSDNAPKNQFMIQVADNALELTVNGARGYHINSSKLAKAGPFVIDVNGTVTLENPRCTGK